jgi:hypothetical protein
MTIDELEMIIDELIVSVYNYVPTESDIRDIEPTKEITNDWLNVEDSI